MTGALGRNRLPEWIAGMDSFPIHRLTWFKNCQAVFGQLWLKKLSNFQVLRRKMKFTCLIALSTKIPKIIFFPREALISEERRPENVGKMGNNRDIIVMQIGGWSISKENISPYPRVPKPLSCLNFPTCQTKF